MVRLTSRSFSELQVKYYFKGHRVVTGGCLGLSRLFSYSVRFLLTLALNDVEDMVVPTATPLRYRLLV